MTYLCGPDLRVVEDCPVRRGDPGQLLPLPVDAPPPPPLPPHHGGADGGERDEVAVSVVGGLRRVAGGGHRDGRRHRGGEAASRRGDSREYCLDLSVAKLSLKHFISHSHKQNKFKFKYLFFSHLILLLNLFLGNHKSEAKKFFLPRYCRCSACDKKPRIPRVGEGALEQQCQRY